MTLQNCQKVFIAVDFSPESAEAAQEGLHLAKLLNAAALLHHVIHDSSAKPGFYHKKKTGKVRHLRDAAEEMMAEFIKEHKLAKMAKELGVALTTGLSAGLPAERIVHAAHEAKVGLIVMSTVAKSGLVGLLEGSVARKVIKKADLPVLVVKRSKNH